MSNDKPLRVYALFLRFSARRSHYSSTTGDRLPNKENLSLAPLPAFTRQFWVGRPLSNSHPKIEKR
ncbi:MAG: hypothetical protein KME32_10855 [Mojavia pulchra JT2-VF2]|uniref:Uncharacterized protein n=1 Tax=Mojavia pulchra JT2-VF2 TaxID=287848 RepID=A0A951UFL3_9NOST|nr:hypothetical protein [Mojavia pulchra JT2-VF2]